MQVSLPKLYINTDDKVGNMDMVDNKDKAGNMDMTDNMGMVALAVVLLINHLVLLKKTGMPVLLDGHFQGNNDLFDT